MVVVRAFSRSDVWAVGYSTANTSPILKLFLSRLDELKGLDQSPH